MTTTHICLAGKNRYINRNNHPLRVGRPGYGRARATQKYGKFRLSKSKNSVFGNLKLLFLEIYKFSFIEI